VTDGRAAFRRSGRAARRATFAESVWEHCMSFNLGRRIALRSVVLSLVVGVALVPACTRSDDRPEVVVYTSADDVYAREVLAAFEQASGIRVVARYDTEAVKTVGLVNALRAERANPRADVFWSSEPFMTIQLADEGVLAPHESDAAADWPESFRDPERRWYGFAPRGRVIVYSTERVSEEELPKTWMDATNDRWSGRVVMADPRFGTTRGHFGAKRVYWDTKFMPGFYNAWLEGLAENGIRMLTTGNAGVVEAVASGEADIGFTDTDDVWAAQRRGMKVDLIYPRHDVDPSARGGGTLLIPNTVARVTGGPNPESAAALIDFLLSPETELILMRTPSRNIPLRPERLDAAARAEAAELAVDDPLRVNLAAVAAAMDASVDAAMRILDAER